MQDKVTNPNADAKKETPLLVDNMGRLKVDKRRSVQIDHAGAANAVIKHINVVPNLSVESRMIMTIRVMNPGIKLRYIAQQMKISEYDVRMYEHEGLNRCAAYIKHLAFEESIKKFNMDKFNTESTKIMDTNINPANPLISGIDQNAAAKKGA